ncbi:hypothetical protein [Accumulibacter sp.]|uniref:hypothetical protein n=1 Tax=Accumulibacter sp. TaxID=2053492 RepID=UPI001ACEC3F7|nr:hypothetical protein [Accumulibacter sp.]MBN8453179.1 hypothetical protein [Accumulibacter sp.]
MFYFANEELTPRKLGQLASASSSQSAPDVVKTMVNREEHRSDSIFTRIKLMPRIAGFEIMALHIAAFYVYAQFFLKSPPSHMAEVYSGIRSDVETWLKASPGLVEHLDSALRAYGLALASELRSPPPDDIGFNIDYGPTAKLAAQRVTNLYAEHPEFKGQKLDVEKVDAIVLQICIKTSLTSLLSILQQKLTYKGDTVESTLTKAGGGIELPAIMTSPARPVGRTSLPDNNPPGYKPLTVGNKIFLAVFAMILFLGLMKLIFRY